MGDNENIHSYMTKLNDHVLGITCFSGKIEEDQIVAKVLRSLPPTYKQKVATIDEIWSVTTITRDMLFGKITTFELRKFGESHGKSMISFKSLASVSGKQKYDPDECMISRYEREGREIAEKERELDELEALIA